MTEKLNDADRQWLEDYTNITTLGRALIQQMNYDATEIQRYYEKPWAWSDEWHHLQRHGDLYNFEVTTP